MAVHCWGRFGEAAVRMMGQVRPGENLLIVADTWTDVEIAKACLIAGISAKASAQLRVIPNTSLVDTREYNSLTPCWPQRPSILMGYCSVRMIS